MHENMIGECLLAIDQIVFHIHGNFKKLPNLLTRTRHRLHCAAAVHSPNLILNIFTQNFELTETQNYETTEDLVFVKFRRRAAFVFDKNAKHKI